MGLEAELRAIVGSAHLLTDPDVSAGYATDWTGQYRGRAIAVARPGTGSEVAAVVAACHRERVAVVPQGGNTGLVGGSVPGDDGAVVVSTRRLAGVEPVDGPAGQVTVGAGTTLAAAQQAVRAAGWAVPVDLAARDSATLGGMAATNAGGMHVMRHGPMRRQVLGYEAALADGTVLTHLAGLEKDNTGYDLGALLCGSEGTLAVLTRLRLRLVPLLPHRVTALLAWAGLEDMIAGLAHLRAEVPELDTAEYVVRPGVELVETTLGVGDPFGRPYPAYLVVEAAGTIDPTNRLAAAVAGLDGVLDVAVAETQARRHELWRLRELHTEALAAAGPPRKYDVTVPIATLAAFVAAAVALVEAVPGRRCHHFGHLGDGNVHLNVLGPVTGQLDGEVYSLVAAHGGSISAEHGIGRLKRPWLHLSRSTAEIDSMRAVKRALDPAGTLNPGVLLPD